MNNNRFHNPNRQQGMQYNPNFNTQNPQIPYLNGPNMNNFHVLNPNLQTPNNQLGVIQLLAAQIQNNPQLQMNLLNQLQAQNFAAPFQQGGMPFMGQMMGVPSMQFLGGQGQMVQGLPMMGFTGNPGLCMNGMGAGFGNVPCGVGENPAFGSQQFQVNQAEPTMTDDSHFNSHNSASRGPVRNSHGPKELPHNRFQKSQAHYTRNSKGSMKQFNKRGGKGQRSWSDQKFQPTNSGEEASKTQRRPLLLNYTKTEIQLWREARRRNFPTRANTNKKAGDSENKDDADAKLRRQQLKEVLAKQAELGVDVAEIPPSYLSESETQVLEKENLREVTDGRDANRLDKRRGRGRGRGRGREHGRDNWQSKRQKFNNKSEAPTIPPSVKREPSLLEKLLSADIKREKSRLLQVFRFMVLNDFFKHWPDKPVQFPVITVKDDGVPGNAEILANLDPSPERADSSADEALEKVVAEEIGHKKEKLGSVVEVTGDIDEVTNDNIMGEDNVGEQFEDESEEGEITD